METIKANRTDKAIVIDILSESFAKEPQINYIVGEGGNKEKRIKRLMSYGFEQAMVNGKVELSEDKKAVAIWRNHHSNKMTWRLLIENIRFVLDFGFKRLGTISKMEKAIQANYPQNDTFYYLWFIGTLPDSQGKGYAFNLLQPWFEKAKKEQIEIYLETSTDYNLSFYKKKGFEIYNSVTLEGVKSQMIYLLKKA